MSLFYDSVLCGLNYSITGRKKANAVELQQGSVQKENECEELVPLIGM